VGIQRAFAMMATNPTLSAAEVHELGIIARVVDDEVFEAEVEALVSQLASAPSEAIARLKRLLRLSLHSSLEDQLANEADSVATIAASDATLEILDAFVARSKSR
jgi:2-(1,2-epoxy-1,2-dihydrophenyl)acetyl-CoA isomerase